MIPDAAVEAARRAFNEKLAWCDRHSIDPRREDGLALHAALEAAAPHMLAEVWDEGFEDGKRQDAEGDDGPRFVNPYRSQA